MKTNNNTNNNMKTTAIYTITDLYFEDNSGLADPAIDRTLTEDELTALAACHELTIEEVLEKGWAEVAQDTLEARLASAIAVSSDDVKLSDLVDAVEASYYSEVGKAFHEELLAAGLEGDEDYPESIECSHLTPRQAAQVATAALLKALGAPTPIQAARLASLQYVI